MKFCQSEGIQVTGYSPLGSADRPWASKSEPVLLQDPKLIAIADRLGKSVSQVGTYDHFLKLKLIYLLLCKNKRCFVWRQFKVLKITSAGCKSKLAVGMIVCVRACVCV